MTAAGVRRVQVSDVEAFMAHLEARDRGAALDGVAALFASGLSTSDIVASLLGAAQREVGQRWQTGEWSVSQEHVASAIVDDVLQSISARAAPASRARVAVACVEREYHAIPARMLTEVIRAGGFEVTFLGASLPADAVGALLDELTPLALALSCSLTAHLLEAEGAIAMAHRHGIPVLVGGAAFGTDESRGSALGADGWAPDGDTAVQLLTEWAGHTPVLNFPARLTGDHLAIRASRAELVDAALGQLDGPDATDSRRRRVTFDALTALVDNLAVAVKLDEPTLVVDAAGWSTNRDPGAIQPAALVAALRAVLGGTLPVAAAMLAQAARALEPLSTA